ncbi:MAG: hypothetical protein PWP45_194 [Tepidanaerobacteraceae bacterium]|nr:hypothetical protein [Tepidanaerobacteraceae bacterium]
MYTHVAKCTDNFIRVPTVTGPLEIRLPVVVAKKEDSFLFAQEKTLPEIPNGIKKIETFIKSHKFVAVKGYVIFEIIAFQDIYYIRGDLVKFFTTPCFFAGSIPVSEAHEEIEVIPQIFTRVCFTNSGARISELVLINVKLQCIEYREYFI